MDFDVWFANAATALAFLLKDVVVPAAWPIVVSAVAIGFRKPIASFLRRATRLSPTSLEAAPPTTDQVANDLEPAHPGLANDEEIKPWLEDIDQMVATLPWFKGPNRERELIALAAFYFRAADMEVSYRILFGTQIHYLDLLNASTDAIGSTAHRQFLLHREKAASLNIPPLATVDIWLNVFFARNLATRENGKIAITEKGRQFLVQITKLGLFREKDL